MAYAEPAPVPEERLEGDLNPDLVEKDRQSRVESAIALRAAGANYSEIAELLGYATVAQARQAVERGLASTVTVESREEVRKLILRRTDRLLRSVYSKATKEDHPEHLAAVRTALAILDRQARLVGADAPQEVAVYTPTAAEMAEFIKRQGERMRQGLPKEVDIIEGEVLDDD